MAKKKKRRLKKKYRILRGIYIAVVVIAAIIVIAYAALKFTVRAPEIKQPDDTGSQTSQEIVPGMTTGDHTRREQTYTFMLCCPDQASGNADAIMLVTYDVPNQKIGMLSVPRDTLVDQSSPKINAAMHKGVENLQSVVSDLVGYPIDFYIQIDLDGFRELVDAVGGVDFNVPVEMYYNDPTQDLSIFFQPGMQHLDGEDAMKVCRFRKNGDGTGYPMGDIQRSETVRKLMITVAKKLVANIGKLDQFVSIMQRNIETNLSATDLTWFVTKAVGVNLDSGVSGDALPGDGHVGLVDLGGVDVDQLAVFDDQVGRFLAQSHCDEPVIHHSVFLLYKAGFSSFHFRRPLYFTGCVPVNGGGAEDGLHPDRGG